MAMLVQCPNPACKASCSVAEANSGAPVKCPKCNKPFLVKPTVDGQKRDTNNNQPASNANPFPVLPAEFGRYRILKLLGRGGMGAVYLAQDSQLGRQVALKVPFFGGSDSPQRAERFVREARSAAVLQHPNICTVFDAGQIDGRPFITMAYIAGTPLEQEIDPEAPMPQLRAAEVVRKIALALEHAHGKGIVHRDLKPANVMMAAGGEPVVMDFGLAKRVVDVDPNEAKLTRLGGILGTPSYMAPEQVKGESSAIGPATDVYSLGVMLFELLTGETPYTGAMAVVIGRILNAPAPPVKEFRPDVHPRLDAICRRAMAKAPADRFPSMAELADALGKYLQAPSASPPPLAAPALWLAATVAPSSRPLPLPAPPAAAVVKAPAPVADHSPFDHVHAAPPPKSASRKAKRGRVAAVANRRPKWPILAGAAACLLVAGLAALWAGGAFKVKTADGVLVVQVNEPNAEVFVDGDRVTVTWSDGGKKAEIHVKPGTRKVEVKKDGFGVDGTDLTFRDGDRVVFTARLVPEQVAKADAPPPAILPPPPDTKKPDPSPVAGAADDDKGFVSLFNGKDLTGWQGLVPINERSKLSPEELAKKQKEADEKDLPHWTVQDGILVYDGQGDNLQTVKDYGDFELYVDWKIPSKGDSGIYLRGNPQVQIWDSDNLGEDLKKDWHTGSGGLWNNKNHSNQPLVKADNPVGEWNTFHIVMKGDKVTVFLDHLLVVDGTPLENYWEPGKPLPAKGPIELQHHGDKLWFKNIRIKELPPADAAAPPMQPEPAPPTDPFQSKSVWVNEGKSAVRPSGETSTI